MAGDGIGGGWTSWPRGSLDGRLDRVGPLQFLNLSENPDLSGADLRHANLGGAILRDAYFNIANLIDADLSDAELRGASLWAANLCGANLTGSDLRDSVLVDANLTGANLEGASLAGAKLKDDPANILATAEHLWKQGEHDGAWIKIEGLEPFECMEPEVIGLRLRILTNLGRRARRVVDSTKSARVSSNEWID